MEISAFGGVIDKKENSDEESSGDDDNDDDDDNNDSEEDTNKNSQTMSTREAREQIVPILVSELEKEALIFSSDSKTLSDLFAADNAVLNAALDVYDLDGDMAELVDTLKRICSLSTEMLRDQ